MKHSTATALVLALVLAAPSLSLGIMLDDHLHPEIVSAALGHADRALFGERWWLQRACSVAWYLVLVAGAAALYRRTLPVGIAAVAAIAFALRGSHGAAVASLATGSGVVAAAGAVWGLWAWLRWREERWRWGVPLAALASAAGLAAGEAALGALAYWVAYELVGRPSPAAADTWDSQPRGQRLWSLAYKAWWSQGQDAAAATPTANAGDLGLGLLLPMGVLAPAYLLLHHGLGHGGSHSQSYALAPLHVAALVGGDLLSLPVDFWLASPALRWTCVGTGALALAAMAWLVRALWPTLAPAEQRAVRWLAAGAAGSLLVSSAGVPTLRTLVVPSLGTSALLALLVVHGWRQREQRAVRVAVRVFALTTVGLGLLLWPAQILIARKLSQRLRAVAHSPAFAAAPTDGAHWVVLATPDFLYTTYLRQVRLAERLPNPATLRTLSTAPGAHRLRRTTLHRFELEPLGDTPLGDAFAGLFRDQAAPPGPGMRVELPEMIITVLAANGAHRQRIEVETRAPLDDASLAFFTFDGARPVRFQFPLVGDEVVLPRQRLASCAVTTARTSAGSTW